MAVPCASKEARIVARKSKQPAANVDLLHCRTNLRLCLTGNSGIAHVASPARLTRFLVRQT